MLFFKTHLKFITLMYNKISMSFKDCFIKNFLVLLFVVKISFQGFRVQNTTREGVVFNQISIINVTGLNFILNLHSNILHQTFIYVSYSFYLLKDALLWDQVMFIFFLHVFLIKDSGCFVFGRYAVEKGTTTDNRTIPNGKPAAK